MKKLFTVLLLATLLVSCTEQKLITAYDKIYTYRVYDNVTMLMYYTNDVKETQCGITFVDHDKDTVTISDGQYSYIKLK